MNLQNTPSISSTPNRDLSDTASPTALAKGTGLEEQVSCHSILHPTPSYRNKTWAFSRTVNAQAGSDKPMPKY